jgi:hypothetical protein
VEVRSLDTGDRKLHLGTTNKKAAGNYLNCFNKTEKKEYANMLTAFK